MCSAEDGAGALALFEREQPNLLLLDFNMPELNGLEVCREVRRRSMVPMMLLTVRDQEDDLVAALDSDADDYVRKPFSPRALLARVRALARRSEPVEGGIVEYGNARLNVEQHTFQIGDGAAIHLTPLELKALQLLMTSAGRTVGRATPHARLGTRDCARTSDVEAVDLSTAAQDRTRTDGARSPTDDARRRLQADACDDLTLHATVMNICIAPDCGPLGA